MSSEPLHFLFALTTSALALALAFVLGWQSVNRARVGKLRWRVRRRRVARLGLTLAALALALAVIAFSQVGREPQTLAMLALSIALIGASPGFQDSAWGERGVQRGWYARRLEDLEAWRLIGEHLRWKLFGDWVATDVPETEHAALRLELEKLAPGKEAAHGNAGFDPQRAAATKSNS